MTPDEHEENITVPLVIYVGDERRVIGDAVITGGEVRCFVDKIRGGKILEEIREERLTSLSVEINPPPATPVLRDGHVRWVKDYRKGPTEQ